MIITADAEQRYIRAIFSALGASEDQSAALADLLTEADLRGHGSHGLVRVVLNVNLLKKADVEPGATPHVIRETGPTAVFDGARSNGPHAAIVATRDAMRRARQYGVGAVSVQNCGHIGLAGYYVEMAAREGLIGILFAKSESSVHPHGGLEPLLGTNPVAIAVPAEPDPLLLDMSTSAVAAGKVREALRAGAALPPGSAVDPEGRPTTDPQAAIDGALTAMGGAKGYGLALAVEILGGLLAGGSAGPMKATGGRRQLWGALILVLDPAAFVDADAFTETVISFLRSVQTSRRAPRSAEILVPGERSFRTRAERLKTGVPIQDEVWRQVGVLARELGIDPDDYAGAPSSPS
jgi:LDH2 family malate/lactate/ureidoglycolate dehydrogenase